MSQRRAGTYCRAGISGCAGVHGRGRRRDVTPHWSWAVGAPPADDRDPAAALPTEPKDPRGQGDPPHSQDPPSPGPSALARRERPAHALVMTAGPHGTAPSDLGLLELDREQCLALLASVPVGRLVCTSRAMPAVIPLRFLLRQGSVYLRTTEAAGLRMTRDGVVVAFEADAFDGDHRTGWSVGRPRPSGDRDRPVRPDPARRTAVGAVGRRQPAAGPAHPRRSDQRPSRRDRPGAPPRPSGACCDPSPSSGGEPALNTKHRRGTTAWGVSDRRRSRPPCLIPDLPRPAARRAGSAGLLRPGLPTGHLPTAARPRGRRHDQRTASSDLPPHRHRLLLPELPDPLLRPATLRGLQQLRHPPRPRRDLPPLRHPDHPRRAPGRHLTEAPKVATLR